MTETDRENALDSTSPPNAAEEEALDWLLRKDRGSWSQGEQNALDTWLSQSWANTVAYWRAEAAWERADRLGAMKFAMPQRHTAAQGTTKRTILKVAAVVVFAAAAGVATLYSSAPHDKLYSTGVGGHETLALADGTRIELNTDTTIRVSVADGRGAVKVEKGEAFFDVRHDARRPFIVTAGNARIADLGTQFAVRRGSDGLHVTLVEGKAQISVANTKPTALLPGDVALATADQLLVTHKPLPVLSKDLAWRRGVLIFDNTTLADVAAQFNRYNQTKLVLADTAVARITVGGTFATDDVAAFARVATGVFGLHVENRNGTIVVSR